MCEERYTVENVGEIVEKAEKTKGRHNICQHQEIAYRSVSTNTSANWAHGNCLSRDFPRTTLAIRTTVSCRFDYRMTKVERKPCLTREWGRERPVYKERVERKPCLTREWGRERPVYKERVERKPCLTREWGRERPVYKAQSPVQWRWTIVITIFEVNYKKNITFTWFKYFWRTIMTRT